MGAMTPWQRWVQRPQSLWFRKALFQIHLWVGIGVGAYIVVIAASGSAIVYGPAFHRTVVVADTGHPRLVADEMRQAIRHAYPAYEVLSVVESAKRDQPDVVLLWRDN